MEENRVQSPSSREIKILEADDRVKLIARTNLEITELERLRDEAIARINEYFRNKIIKLDSIRTKHMHILKEFTEEYLRESSGKSKTIKLLGAEVSLRKNPDRVIFDEEELIDALNADEEFMKWAEQEGIVERKISIRKNAIKKELSKPEPNQYIKTFCKVVPSGESFKINLSDDLARVIAYEPMLALGKNLVHDPTPENMLEYEMEEGLEFKEGTNGNTNS